MAFLTRVKALVRQTKKKHSLFFVFVLNVGGFDWVKAMKIYTQKLQQDALRRNHRKLQNNGSKLEVVATEHEAKIYENGGRQYCKTIKNTISES